MDRKMMRLPNLISTCRLAAAPVLLVLAWYGYARLLLVVLVVSFASDVLDGYLARRFGQVSELGTRLDSIGDFAIYSTIPLAAWWLWPGIVRREAPFFIVVIVSFTLPPLLAFLKFRQFASYHTLMAKLAALLVGGSGMLLFAGGPAWCFRLATPVSIIAACEEIAITLMLAEHRANVRSLWHAMQMKQSETRS
jgi:phosphatidylglycerophosphate synthase